MSQYLVVANQTASSPSLAQCVATLAGRDPEANFTLLVPATPVAHLAGFEEGDARSIARRVAQAGKASLEAAGTRVTRAVVGDASPLLAIDDELREHPGTYASIIIATLPPGMSRWLRVDLPERTEDKFGISVVHVTAQPSPNLALPPGDDGEGDGSSTIPVVVSHLIRALAGNTPLPMREARRALQALGPVVVPYVAEATNNRDANIRMGAFKVLAKTATAEAAPTLIEALEDPDGGIRWLAAEGLVRAGPKALAPLLLALIRRSDSAWLQDGVRHVLHGMRGQPDYPAEALAPLDRRLNGLSGSVTVMTAANDALKALRAAAVTEGVSAASS
jgi:hypothetical protein